MRSYHTYWYLLGFLQPFLLGFLLPVEMALARAFVPMSTTPHPTRSATARGAFRRAPKAAAEGAPTSAQGGRLARPAQESATTMAMAPNPRETTPPPIAGPIRAAGSEAPKKAARTDPQAGGARRRPRAGGARALASAPRGGRAPRRTTRDTSLRNSLRWSRCSRGAGRRQGGGRCTSLSLSLSLSLYFWASR